MTEQPTLFGPTPAAGPALGPRQALVHDLLHAHPEGLPADEIGARLHDHRRKHPADQRCDWCTREALGVLRSKALRPLVIHRRTARVWQLRIPPAPDPQEPDDDGEIPW